MGEKYYQICSISVISESLGFWSISLYMGFILDLVLYLLLLFVYLLVLTPTGHSFYVCLLCLVLVFPQQYLCILSLNFYDLK